MVELVIILTQIVFNPILLSLLLFYVHYIYLCIVGVGKKRRTLFGPW